MGSCWGHVARLLAIGQDQLRACYVPEIGLDKRGDNDSFLDRGVVNRFKIAVDGFVGIAAHFYGEGSPETRNVKRYLRNELPASSFLYARQRIVRLPDVESKAELDRIFELCYSSCGFRGWIARMAYYHLPVAVYRHLKSLYKLMRGGVRWARGRAKEMKHA
jgi:abequosyltransferase